MIERAVRFAVGGAILVAIACSSDDSAIRSQNPAGGGGGGSEAGGSSGGGGDGGAIGSGGGGGAGGRSPSRDAGGDAAPEPCTGSVPIQSDGGLSGGYERCASGLVHRPIAGRCGSALEPKDAAEPLPPGLSDASVAIRQCRVNGDCAGTPHSYCGVEFPPWSGGAGGAPTQTCHTGCVEDSECGAGEICLCGDPVGTCVKASCRTDADCPTGILCEERPIDTGCGPIRLEFRCGPQCHTNADCADGTRLGTVTCVDGTCRPGTYCT